MLFSSSNGFVFSSMSIVSSGGISSGFSSIFCISFGSSIGSFCIGISCGGVIGINSSVGFSSSIISFAFFLLIPFIFFRSFMLVSFSCSMFVIPLSYSSIAVFWSMLFSSSNGFVFSSISIISSLGLVSIIFSSSGSSISNGSHSCVSS